MSKSSPAMTTSEKTLEIQELIERAMAQGEEQRRGLRGILNDLEMESARFLEPRGHWPIPGGSAEADKYRWDYYDSGAASSEPDDGNPPISDVLDLVVGTRLYRELLDNGTAALDVNYYGWWLVNFGMKAERLAFAPARKLALSAIRSKEGAAKGNRSVERLGPIEERNAAILETARELLIGGRERRDLPALFATRFANNPDFPSSKRQYRKILEQLDK